MNCCNALEVICFPFKPAQNWALPALRLRPEAFDHLLADRARGARALHGATPGPPRPQAILTDWP
jgi:hypothetical protein